MNTLCGLNAHVQSTGYTHTHVQIVTLAVIEVPTIQSPIKKFSFSEYKTPELAHQGVN